MTRLSALLMVLTAFAFGAVGQTTPPTPHDPEIWEWIDYYDSSQPNVFMSDFMFYVFQDSNSDLVDNRYRSFAEDNPNDIVITGEPKQYSTLDPAKLSYSLFTDYNKKVIFRPEDFIFVNPHTGEADAPIFDAPTSEIPYEFRSPHFFPTSGNIMFQSRNFCNNVEGKEDFFKYRIGVQLYYTENGQRSASNIVWYGELPPTIKGDVNFDGTVDVSDLNILVAIVLGSDNADNYDGRAYVTEDDKTVDVADINEVVSIILSSN